MDRKKTFFLLSAATTALIYLGLLYLFSRVFDRGTVLSVTGAYFLAMAWYFLTNKLIVFRSTSGKDTPRQIMQFAIAMGINYLISLGIITGMKTLTGEIYLGSVVAGIVTTALAYLVFERYLFSSRTSGR